MICHIIYSFGTLIHIQFIDPDIDKFPYGQAQSESGNFPNVALTCKFLEL